MSMIYFAGEQLDYRTVDNDLPVVIRGYDKAGNLLSSVRTNHLELSLTEPGISSGYNYYWDGFLSDGTAATGAVKNANKLPNWAPACVAANSDGHLYAPTKISAGYSSDAYPGQYTVGVPDFIRVFRRNGDRIPFPQLHGAAILAVAVDASDNVYVGGWESGAERYNFRKYTQDGTLIWSRSGAARSPSPQIVETIHIADDGAIYVAGRANYVTESLFEYYFLFAWIAKYDADGTEEWAFNFYSSSGGGTAAISSLSTSADSVFLSALNGFSYWRPFTGAALNDFTGDNYPRYFDIEQNIALILKIAADEGGILAFYGKYPPEVAAGFPTLSGQYGYFDGMLYGARSTLINDDHDYFIHDADDLTLVSSAQLNHQTNTFLPFVIAVDSNDGVLYFGSRRRVMLPSQNNWFFQFRARAASGADVWSEISSTSAAGVNSGGVPVTTDEYLAQTYTTPYGVTSGPDLGNASAQMSNGDFWSHAAIHIRRDTGLPSIQIPIGYGSVDWHGDRYILIDGLAIPVALRPPTLRREYVGALRLPDLYSLTLTGSPDLQLPLARIQCRQNAYGMALTVLVPVIDGATIAEVLARDGGDLIISRGVRFTDGTGQVDPMFRVKLSTIRYDIGGKSATLTLGGDLSTVAALGGSRALSGIGYRAISGGKRRVRCAIDSYLTPGDTAILGGGESMVVGELTYSISPSEGVMEVSEA